MSYDKRLGIKLLLSIVKENLINRYVMFSFFCKKENIPLLQNEHESVQYFIKNSYHFNKLKESAARYTPYPGHENSAKLIVEDIENSISYFEIIHALSYFDMEKSDNLFAYNMGRNKMSVLTGILGFIWESPHFAYHAIELLRNTEETYCIYFSAKNNRILL